SLADAVRAIRAAAGDRAATAALARAHRAYAAGRVPFEEADYRRAESHFAAAEAAADGSAALRGWARVYLGTTQVHNGEREKGERLLATATAADPARHPALAARARWSLGNTRARRDQWVSGVQEAVESARLFARAGERENEGAALNIATDAYVVLGEPDSGYVTLHRALDRLRPYRGSVRLHNLLTPAARIAAADGLPRAAARLQDEGVAVAVRNGNPRYEAEAYLARARLHAAAGDTAAAARDVRAARPRVGAVEEAPARPWLDADLREAEAMVSFRGDPARTTEALDSAAAYFGRIPLPFRTLPALVGGAEARLAARDTAGAAARLERALRLLEERRDSIRMEPRRAAVFEAFRGVVDRLAMLKLAEGRAAEALDIMDRGRASLASAGAAARHGTDGGVRSPPGEVAVEYARVADTLVMWTVAGRRVEVARAAIDTLRLARTLAALEAMLERRAGEAEVRPALSLLHDWLVRPLEGRLGGVGTPLVVVADGELTAVPFAALFDARRERYLVEDHPLRFAASLREARRPAARTVTEGVLFVADPAFDRTAYPLLEPLEHARVEVRRIAEDYGSVTVLEGAAANLPAVMVALRRAGIVHFAGHAVFDDARPERSHLVLAPAPGRGGAGKVTAAELAEADLRHVRLVVLSACRTVRTGRARTAGYTGLAGALRAAGAGGVVGSTWDVDDRLTAALMPVFHQRYARSGDGPRALREAQLTLLHSADAALRTPAAWAGFRYTGR
ncbi:MAG TPA: CHAT domain-containing protein, partial [Longimicrobium sp.]|nr:CHAT domain-containing protein [Longimicrobium sp.]